MDCILCGKKLIVGGIEFGGKDLVHPQCLTNYHEDLDEQYVHDCLRQYGLKKVKTWIDSFTAGVVQNGRYHTHHKES